MDEPKRTKKTLRIITLIVLYLSLPLFIFFTNPQNLPLPLLVLPIALLFLIIFTTVYLLIVKNIPSSKRISKTRLYIISAIVAIVPVMLIVLASIGQFTLRDIILSAVIVICMAWYLIKVDFLKN
jgi:4-amino-4-deoxy-L-arabinose transferase-like glycosyltransferase